MNLEHIRDAELRQDWRECLKDIHDCEWAISKGVTTYGDGQGHRNVVWRLAENRKQLAVIEGEIARRAAPKEAKE